MPEIIAFESAGRRGKGDCDGYRRNDARRARGKSGLKGHFPSDSGYGGYSKTADTVEKIGVDRALEHAKDADLILYVVDASVPLDENDAKSWKF